MGVVQTGAIFKSLTFDGESSRDYGVYISGSGVYNSPERDVEMITIPYRNGAFVQDNGRFNNIEVTYPAGVYADTEEDFAQAVSDFRNFLASKVGYCRLEDEYHPDEYREAVYKSGLEVTPKMLKAGEFNIVFECKPQRFLKSGEERTEKTSSSWTITNPTLFESKPLLELYGTGSATVNGGSITSTPSTLGALPLEFGPGAQANQCAVTNRAQYNTGDTIRFYALAPAPIMTIVLDYGSVSSMNVVKNSGSNWSANWTASNGRVLLQMFPPAVSNKWTFNAGDTSVTLVFSFTVTINGSTTETFSGNGRLGYNDSGAYFYVSHTSISSSRATITDNYNFDYIVATVDSTATVGGNPTYVDLETGDAYAVIDGEQVLVNDSVQIPARLPVLKPGSNTITKTGLSKVAVTPRWWIV